MSTVELKYVLNQIENLIANNLFKELSEFLNESKLPQNILNQCISKYLTYNNREQLIQIFLNNGGDVNTFLESKEFHINSMNKKTLLIFSVIHGQFNLFTMLLTFRPNIIHCDSEGKSAAVYTILLNDVSKPENYLIRLINADRSILEQHYQIEGEEYNLFTYAAKNNKIKIIDLLSKTPIDFNFRSSVSGNTALHYAVLNDNVEMAQFLLSKVNCNPRIRNEKNKTPMSLSVELRNNTFFRIFSEDYKRNGYKNYSKKIYQKEIHEDNKYINKPYVIQNTSYTQMNPMVNQMTMMNNTNYPMKNRNNTQQTNNVYNPPSEPKKVEEETEKNVSTKDEEEVIIPIITKEENNSVNTYLSKININIL
ncbi:MAG: ankyrin repeat domain-containing protein [archaeon]|nr:ankyrin repeat domain-containing protein [archaeon]